MASHGVDEDRASVEFSPAHVKGGSRHSEFAAFMDTTQYNPVYVMGFNPQICCLSTFVEAMHRGMRLKFVTVTPQPVRLINSELLSDRLGRLEAEAIRADQKVPAHLIGAAALEAGTLEGNGEI